MIDVLDPGTEVDDYRIEKPIGYGWSAAVYEATDTYLKRRVALKVMYSAISNNPIFQARFRREGWIHSSLEHPNIVPVFKAGESDEHGFWIAMKLMKGGSLEERLKGRPLGPDQTIALLTPIAAALDFAHAEGQIHRDVKPQNILLDEDDVPRLTDFGIAMSVDGSRLTITGQGVGTPGYVAPEQREGKKHVDTRADVYSLATVLFQCLTGEVPLPEATGISLGGLRLTKDIPHASDRNPELPTTIDPVIRKGMEKRPSKRHKEASILIDEAREALEENEARSSQASAHRLRQRGILRAGIVVLLAFLGLGLGAATKPSPQPAQVVAATTAGVELKGPPGWSRSRGRPVVSGLGVSKPVSLAPAPDSGGTPLSVSAGISAAAGAALLPPAYREQLGNGTRRVSVALGPLAAYRYSGIEAPGSRTPVTIFAAPTSLGVALLACRMPRGKEGRSMARLCARVASTLRLRKGTAYPLGPSAAFAKALRKRLTKLAERRASGRGELSRANDANGQASAADDLADAFRAAAKGLASVHLSPESASARARVVSALRSTRDAYRALAVVARQEDQARYAAAGAAVDADERAVNARLQDLRELGYRIGGGVSGGGKAPA